MKKGRWHYVQQYAGLNVHSSKIFYRQ